MKYLPFSQTKIMNSFFKPARISPKEISGANGKFLPKPLLFHLRHPNSKTNEPKFWQILSPKNSFAKTSSALFRHLPEYLEGRTPKRKKSFPFSEEIGRAQIRKARNFFSFWGCRVKRGGGGTIRAYDLVSLHHARGACDIICFENRFELGTINTPKQNSTAFSKPEGGTRFARPTDFPPFFQTNSEFLARWRAPVFRQGGGSKSEAILANSICLIQREFLLL